MSLDAIAACVQAVETVAGEWVSIHRIDLDLLAQRADCTAREERDAWRASRFRFERDRRRYLASRLALRHLLAAALGADLAALRLAEDGNGKPCLVDEPDRCHFNLSHSGGLALIALSRAAPVGVDLELAGMMEADGDLVAACLCPAERCQWNAIGLAARRRAFLDLCLGLYASSILDLAAECFQTAHLALPLDARPPFFLGRGADQATR